LLDCFINGDLIPGVILWQSESYLFVIDGGHRLSALKAWVIDDYGDGPLSRIYFGDSISSDQKRAANRTRQLIAEGIGSYQQFKTKIEQKQFDPQVAAVATRGIQIQWVKGDVSKAESSFFKINTQGTPLDDIEEQLLANRAKPIAIASRAVVRAGFGHKYWSKFPHEATAKIEERARNLHTMLLDPEISQPIKTLDLPIGGAKGLRQALQIMIDYISISCEANTEKPLGVKYGTPDSDGSQTLEVLSKAIRLTQKITGNDHGSLGLHPAVYFYGPSGLHQMPFFLGTSKVIAKALMDNNKQFFIDFTKSREKVESMLIHKKELIATILQKTRSHNRINAYSAILQGAIKEITNGEDVSDEKIVKWSGIKGTILLGSDGRIGKTFSDETKSQAFIAQALKSAIKCPICGGYIDPAKSVSYDHIMRIEDGGNGEPLNCQITHPFCNQSIKN
jgi:hypothetical protein